MRDDLVRRRRPPCRLIVRRVGVADQGRVVPPGERAVERRADARVGLCARDDQSPDAEPRQHFLEDTTLETVLSGLGVGRLVVVGAQTDACIRSTLHGAFARGYDATLVSDAHTTEDQSAWGAPPPDQVIAHTNLYWTYQTAPGRTAGTVETKDVDFGGTS